MRSMSLVNRAIKEFFIPRTKRPRKSFWIFSGSEYGVLDPEGILKEEGIRIYFLPG